MGRHRIHTDNAARQRAYRERLKAAGLGSFGAGDTGLAATQARQGASVTSAQRAMTARVAKTVQSIDPSIDTSALR